MSNVNFQLVDVDANTGFNDRVTLSGTLTVTDVITGGRTYAAHDISGNVVQAWNGTGSVTNSVCWTDLSDFEGAVQVVYGGVSGFIFTYDNGPGALSNPVAQNMGIYDVSFTVAPEPGTGALLILGCRLVALRRRRA